MDRKDFPPIYRSKVNIIEVNRKSLVDDTRSTKHWQETLEGGVRCSIKIVSFDFKVFRSSERVPNTDWVRKRLFIRNWSSCDTNSPKRRNCGGPDT